jgi:hypothetical protein
MSLSGVNAGYLDVRNAILRVGTLDVQTIVSGVDTATNIAKTNTILLWDDQGSDMNSPPFILTSATRSTSPPYLELGGGFAYAGIKLPNAWLGAFEVYMSDKTDGSIKLHTYTTDTTTYGDTGYELVLDNSGVTLNYDGAQVATAAYTWTNDTWHQVVVGFERGAWTVSVDGTPTLIKDDIEREAVYANVGQYLRLDAASATTTKRVRYVKFAANGHWLQSSTGALSYTQGNVGIGVTNPARTFHVRGQSTVWRLDRDRNSAALHMHRFPTGDWTAPWKGYALGVDASGVDTGEFFIGDYGTAVSGGQTRRLTIDNTGNVIIGTQSTGSHLLEVYGTANTGTLTTTSASITDVTHSTSKDTGALLVTDGGLGVESNIHSTNVFAASHVGVGTTATSYNLDVAGTANVGAITMNSNVYAPNLQVAQVASNLVTWNSATGDFMDSGGLISNKFAVVSAMPPRQMTDYTDVINGHGTFKLSLYTNRSGSSAYNIIGPNDAYWRSSNTKITIAEYTAHVIALEFPYKVVARSVSWKSTDFRRPRAGHVLASNDKGVTWDTLFSFSGDAEYDNSSRFIRSLNNSTAYKIYAFAVTAHDDASTTINNLQFFTESFSVDGGIVTTTAASGLETGFTEHPVAPMTDYNTYVEGHGTYEASASNFTSGHEPWEAYTNIQGDPRWITNTNGYNSDGTYTGSVVSTDIGGTRYSGEWNQLKFPYAQTISHIDLYATGGVGIERAPTVGVILGSNDGEHWYKLTEFSGKTYIVNIATRIDVNATLSYMYVRLVCTNVGTSPSEGRCELNQIHYFSATGVTKMDNVLISGELAVDGGALQTSHIKWPKVPLKANESEGYVASASSVYNTTNFEAWHAFEDKPQYSGSWGPAWLAKIYTFIQSTGEPDTANCATFDNTSCEWIQITQPEAIQLSSFHFKSRLLAEAPKNGSMYGSNDDFITYDKIVSFSGNTQQSAKVDVQSTKRYKSFRLVITQIIGYHYPSIDELQLFESTLGVGTSATTAKLTVDGGLGLAKGSQVFAGSDVITEFPKHDRPLTKYPEVAMTSTSQDGYVVSVSSADNTGSRTTHGAFDGIFDDSFGKGWQSGTRYSTTTGLPNSSADNATFTVAGVDYTGQWVKLELPQKIRVESIVLSSCYNTNTATTDDRRPERGVFLGSNDNSNWELIKSFDNDLGYVDSVFGQDAISTRANSQATLRGITNTSYYKYLMIVITKIATTNQYGPVQINELEYYGYEEGDESVDIVHKSIPNTPGQQQLAVYYEARDPNSYSFADSTKVYDLSGSGVTGTITGNNGFDAEYNAWVLDGSGDYISGTLSNPAGAWVHSVSLWFKGTGLTSSGNHTLFQIGEQTTGNAILSRVETDMIRYTFFDGDFQAAVAINNNQWYHAAFTYIGGSSASDRTIYLNGVKINATVVAGTVGALDIAANEDFTLGSQRAILEGYFPGSIANFRVYGKALSADQVRELYEYDAERFGHRQNLVALHKGNLGVGVPNPTSRFEVAGADGLQEFPPKAMTGYETYIEGHGVFKTNPTILLSLGVYAKPTWKVFDRSTEYLNNGIWHSERDSGEVSGSYGFYTGTSDTYTGTNSLNGLYGDYIILENPYKINVTKMYLKPRINGSGNAINVIRAFTLMASNDGSSTWDILAQKSELTSWTSNGYTFDVQNTNHYIYYALVVTQAVGSYATLSELRYYGTPAPSALEDGHLTLGKALTLPRVSGHPTGAETPRAESLVVHYDTTVDSVVSGSTVVDISGEGNNGTLNGDAAYSSTDRAFSFDGVNDYVSGTLNNPAGAWVHSVSCWWKTSIYPGTNYDTIFSIGDFTATEFTTFYIKSNSILVSIYGSGALFPFSLQVDRWYHSTVVMRGTTSSISDIDFYLDGVKLTSSGQFGTATTRALPANASLRLGREVSGGGNFLTGSISNFKLWNVALTAEEVAMEYALGRTGKSINLTDTALCLGGTVPRAQLDVRGGAVVDGFVGIGTTNPSAPLHVLGAGGFTDSSATNLSTSVSKAKLRFQNRIGSSLSQYHGTTDSGYSWYQQIANGDGTTSYDLVLNPFGGYVGIGTTNPSSSLDVAQAGEGSYIARIINTNTGNDQDARLAIETSSASGESQLIFITTDGTTKSLWHITAASGSTGNIGFYYSADDYNGGTSAGYITRKSDEVSLNFTGQHRTFIKNVPFMEAGDLEGLIVSADQNKYIKMSGGIAMGSNAITTNESLPVVSLSTNANDKKCFGVISASEDPETREEKYGNFVSVSQKELGDTRVYINSLGEGAMWVTNINGPLESGDYITTSNVAGYGQRQDDDILHNYTVAKITMDCDFEPPDIPVQRILKELSNITYWYQLEDATSNAYDRTQEETYYTLDRRVEVYGHVDEQSNVFITPEHDLELYMKTQENIVSEEVYNALPEDERVLYDSNTFTYTQVTELVPDVWGSLDTDEQNTYVHGYFNIVTDEVPSETPGAVERTRTLYKKIINETKVEPATHEDYFSEVREEWVNVLDVHGQLQWEDVPWGETEPAYKIRYLDASGQITTRHNEVYRAAFVGVTYHCG